MQLSRLQTKNIKQVMLLKTLTRLNLTSAKIWQSEFSAYRDLAEGILVVLDRFEITHAPGEKPNGNSAELCTEAMHRAFGLARL